MKTINSQKTVIQQTALGLGPMWLCYCIARCPKYIMLLRFFVGWKIGQIFSKANPGGQNRQLLGLITTSYESLGCLTLNECQVWPPDRSRAKIKRIYKLHYNYQNFFSFEVTSAINCMHECLWKTLSQDCPHGKPHSLIAALIKSSWWKMLSLLCLYNIKKTCQITVCNIYYGKMKS